MRRIKKITIQNFKAFQAAETIHLDGKNALFYGNNGSGKSSIFWALYTFLQSSIKSNEEIEKYFKVFDNLDTKTHQSLKNVFCDDDEPSNIELTIVDDAKRESMWRIGNEANNTNLEGDTTIRELNIASDFINYRLLQNFYQATHRREINLWNVFYRDIFPYFYETGTRTYRELVDDLTNMIPRKRGGDLSRKSSARRREFDERIERINQKIGDFVDEIERNGNAFLKANFQQGVDFMEIKLQFSRRLNFERISQNNISDAHLQIKLWVRIYDQTKETWVENHRPHSFLNEAQLTRLALAVRIGALRTRVTQTDLKILVLDDMLISLDLSNRMKVVDLLLNKQGNTGFFDDFQKIILTHDKGFYNLVKRSTLPNDWKYFEIDRNETSNKAPKIKPHWSNLEKAKQYLDSRDFDECATMLRKELEELLKTYLKITPAPERVMLNVKEHLELSDMIKRMKTQLLEAHQSTLKKWMNTRKDCEGYILKIETDFENDATLTLEQKGILRSTRRNMLQALTDQWRLETDAEQLMEDVKVQVDFVLNKSAHSTTNPQYEGELQEAYKVVEKLKLYLEQL
ncbi:MAG: ATP-binding protein [Saprospiraceae bacterium]|nr:ATP-binding protein [Saprospiraceae bacterium]